MKIGSGKYCNIVVLIVNLAWAYAAYVLCRLLFLADNWDLLGTGFESMDKWLLIQGCWKFDTSAICYSNALWMVLLLLPLHVKERDWWHKMLRWIYVLVNSVCIVANLVDVVYFRYAGRRTTASVFGEFANEGNLADVILTEMLNHWWLVLIGIAMVVGLYFAYLIPTSKNNDTKWIGIDKLKYYLIQSVAFVMMVFCCVCGMRGGASTAVRPITLSNANQYVNSPMETGLVLNTPFSIIRSINKSTFVDPHYYEQEELDIIFTPLHTPDSTATMKEKNVVVLIVESFGREYMGAYNDTTFETYTPFIDSLIGESLTFDYTFGNGRKSIDGMPSVLSGIPSFVEPFFLTPSSLNDVSSIAGELRRKGYYSAFFHGAENGSMGFEAYARTSGFEDYYGRTEYGRDIRFGGDKDFDGTWAIWDEEFLQFYALKMSDFEEPFVTSVFTATSHHPFVVPERYQDRYYDEPGDDNKLHKCIRYTDNALRQFFSTAEKQPWYQNTIFVITADHTNLSSRKEYQTALGLFGVPIIIYDPSGEIAPQRRHCIAQQIDIMPTILGFLGYDEEYVSFGKDLFHTPDEETWAVNYSNGVYQYVRGGFLLQMEEDGSTKGLFDIEEDWMLKNNMKGTKPELEKEMKRRLKGIIQSYMQRMLDNKLVADVR